MYRVDHSRNRLCSGTNGRRESKNNIREDDEVALSKTNSRLLADNIRYNIRSRNVSRLVRSVFARLVCPWLIVLRQMIPGFPCRFTNSWTSTTRLIRTPQAMIIIPSMGILFYEKKRTERKSTIFECNFILATISS